MLKLSTHLSSMAFSPQAKYTGSIKYRDVLVWVHNWQALEKGSVPWNQSVRTTGTLLQKNMREKNEKG
jgi:hypothetical protein